MTRAPGLPACLAALCLAPSIAAAQIACIPPEEPYPFPPSDLDAELREIVNRQYQDYLEGIEDYIACLDTERADSIRTANDMLERWVMYFGEDAALTYKTAPDGTSPSRN